ncbi:hypothetical protein BGZ61DRAFT_465344 [Ilyonectria robusta]|uniref:uncharacterized protein n=1 Tax=Ilyonectria robusta TaxID=1079257 RepID=UPI001E8DA067|nr:uncharacterized protein BGZ61DRAFT_465344 [Ilyonectria robusta]KAH8659438.1 hypothetical protein BGZ61DRAFT_465344 [Ilyonectria robusta]
MMQAARVQKPGRSGKRRRRHEKKHGWNLELRCPTYTSKLSQLVSSTSEVATPSSTPEAAIIPTPSSTPEAAIIPTPSSTPEAATIPTSSSTPGLMRDAFLSTSANSSLTYLSPTIPILTTAAPTALFTAAPTATSASSPAHHNQAFVSIVMCFVLLTLVL